MLVCVCWFVSLGVCVGVCVLVCVCRYVYVCVGVCLLCGSVWVCRCVVCVGV